MAVMVYRCHSATPITVLATFLPFLHDDLWIRLHLPEVFNSTAPGWAEPFIKVSLFAWKVKGFQQSASCSGTLCECVTQNIY